MPATITLGLDDKTQAGFEAVVKNIDHTAKSAKDAEAKAAGLNKELANRAASKLGEDLKGLAAQADDAADKMAELGAKYGTTTKQASGLNHELSARATSQATSDAKELADELDHLARSSNTAATRAREFKKELRGRVDGGMKQDVKAQAGKGQASASVTKKGLVGRGQAIASGGMKAASKGVSALARGAANTKATFDVLIQGAQQVGQAVRAMADRGVPAFQRLAGIGDKFEETLMQIGESSEVQEMIDSVSTAAEEVMLPALKEVGDGAGWLFGKTQKWISDISLGVQSAGNAVGLLSDEYIESLNEEINAETEAAVKRKAIREKENQERRAEAQKRKEDREADLRDPGKKMNEAEKFSTGVQTSTQSELAGRIENQKAEMAKQEAIYKKSNPNKDPTEDSKWMKLQDELVQMETRMMDLKKIAREAEDARKGQGYAQDDVEARMGNKEKGIKGDLQLDGKMYGGDEKLGQARSERDAADQNLLNNLVGTDKSVESDRQLGRDRKEIDAYNQQIKGRQDLLKATGQELDKDEELNATIRDRNELEEKLNDKLRERAKLESQLNSEKKDRGENPNQVADFEGEAHDRQKASRARDRSDTTDIKADAKKRAEESGKAELANTKAEVAQNAELSSSAVDGEPQMPPQMMPSQGGMGMPGMSEGGTSGMPMPNFGGMGMDDTGMDDDWGMGMMLHPKQIAKARAKRDAIQKQANAGVAAYRKSLGAHEARLKQEQPGFTRSRQEQKTFDATVKRDEKRIRQNAPKAVNARTKQEAAEAKRKANDAKQENAKRNPFSEKGKREKQKQLDDADKQKRTDDDQLAEARKRIREDESDKPSTSSDELDAGQSKKVYDKKTLEDKETATVEDAQDGKGSVRNIDSDEETPMTMSPGEVADAKEKEKAHLEGKGSKDPKNNLGYRETIQKLEREIKELRERENKNEKKEEKVAGGGENGEAVDADLGPAGPENSGDQPHSNILADTNATLQNNSKKQQESTAPPAQPVEAGPAPLQSGGGTQFGASQAVTDKLVENAGKSQDIVSSLAAAAQQQLSQLNILGGQIDQLQQNVDSLQQASEQSNSNATAATKKAQAGGLRYA
jgi:hypothetical protein